MTLAPAFDDVATIRAHFPILETKLGKKPLIYFDNAASAQRPRAVIERLTRYGAFEHANIHRGVHHLSQAATGAYERARETVANFLGARESRECIFTRGTTEAINLIAHSWGAQHLNPGDEIVLTEMEHHANIVPWQLAAERAGAHIRVAPVSDSGELNLDAFRSLLGPRTKMVAVVHTSNALGTLNPVAEIVALARQAGAFVLIDGAQAAPHGRVDVTEFDPDFFMFSGHKVGGPTGIGVLYGKAEILGELPPYQGGGDMIERVSFDGTTFRGLPERFEAGTPNIEGAIALATALDFIDLITTDVIREREAKLRDEMAEALRRVDGITLYGDVPNKVPVFSFNLPGIHPSDLGTMLDLDGIAVRTGHHCCMPLWQRFGVEGTTRASLAYYNTSSEIETFVESLERARKLLG
ncbi:MAG: aminotransferase class V-fold PLP-dependent enzyme [Opitutales bacterium]